ncbi:MAG: CtsR family transcriptional regulator [Clostridia bacterium]|nr:CtsR family transcriptional regulator [Clostridia bacterium]
MNLSELVALRILELLDAAGGEAEIQRNELASSIGCVPSQINYVLTSRFTPEQGYTVESRRGGGGYIRITRVNLSGGPAIMHIINCIGQTLDFATARALLNDISARGLVNSTTAKVMTAAVSDSSLRECPAQFRDKLRAQLFKQMLMNAI